VQKLRQDLSQLEVRISGEYVRYDRLQDALKPIMAALEEIKTAMSHKADKP
jgi:septation ring formation regulator EzrA